MKDFRAYSEQEGATPTGPTLGGSAFDLPDIVSPLLRVVPHLGWASFALLFRPWQLLRLIPFRRGGGIGAFFSWGRLLAIVIAAMLFFAPDLLQHLFPTWRTMATVCFFVSAISVLGAISRCCGSVVSCAFWVALTLFLGDRTFKPGTMPSVAEYAAPIIASNANHGRNLPIPIEPGEWEDMVTGVPVSARQVAYAHSSPIKRPVQRVTQRSASAPEPGLLDGITGSLTGQLGAVIPSADSITASVPFVGGWSDGAALPESAYFGGGTTVGSVGEAFESSGGMGEGILGQITSFLGM